MESFIGKSALVSVFLKLVEDVVGHNLGLVVSSEVLVKWQGSYLAFVNFEILHLLLGELVHLWVFDVHDG